MSGRGRGKKRSPTSKTAAADAGENQVAMMQHHEAQSTMLLSTSLATLMKVEATLWINSRGADSLYNTISLDKFYSMAREHEWLSSSSVHKSEADTKTITEPTMVPKDVTTLSNEVYEMVHQLSEEERLLFDVMIVSSWNSTEMIASNFYPLYRLATTKGKKVGLEILKPPQSSSNGKVEEPTTMAEKLKLLQEQSQANDTKPSGTRIATRSVVLGNMHQHSRQYLSFSCSAADSNGNSEIMLRKWWEHAKSILQMILDHRSSMGASSSAATTNQLAAADGDKKKPATTTNRDTHHKATSPTKSEMKNMTLEERVRARALLNPKNVKAKQSALEIKISAEATENRALLELASALRAYSQRRGGGSSLGSSSGGGGSSALDRLKHRGSSSASAAPSNIARLTVQAMIKDARLTWNSVVSETVSDQLDTSGGNKMKSKSGVSMVSIDLSRVLFQLRLQMVSKQKKTAGDVDVSEKRQMETQLLNLLEKLASVVPQWIHLRKAPTIALAGITTSKDGEKKKPAAGAKGKTTPKLNIRQSIIVIRNDSVNYATDVRAKLGGRVHNKKSTGTSAAGMSSNSKGVAGVGTKRSLNEREGQHLPVSAADAIVPPSFRRIYGKALDERSPKKVKKDDK